MATLLFSGCASQRTQLKSDSPEYFVETEAADADHWSEYQTTKKQRRTKNVVWAIPRLAMAAVTSPSYGIYALRWKSMNKRYAQLAGVSEDEMKDSISKSLSILGFRSFTAILFRDEIRELLKEPSVRSFLADLLIAIEENDPSYNLYEGCKKHAGSDENAVKWLAVLFNDTRVWVGADSTLGEYGPVLSLVRKKLHSCDIDLYPEDDIPNRSALYHYYVTRYLAQYLVEQGQGKRSAALTAFSMNSEYEFWTSHLFGGLNTSAEDLYLGYRAVHPLMGGRVKGFDDFKAHLTRNRKAWFQYLGWYDIGPESKRTYNLLARPLVPRVSP